MEPHGLKPVVPGLPRLVRYGEILFDNFAILIGVIRQHATLAESAVAPRLFTSHSSTAKKPWYSAKADKQGLGFHTILRHKPLGGS